MARSEAAKAWRQVKANIEVILAAERKAGQETLTIIGIEAVNVIRIMLTHASPSAPGEPPGLVHGGLRLSYDYEVGGEGRRHFVAVGSDMSTKRPITGETVDYAAYLEGGTIHMRARPHLRPAMLLVAATVGGSLVSSMSIAGKAAAAGLQGVRV